MTLSLGIIVSQSVNAYYGDDEEEPEYHKSDGTTYKRFGNVVVSNTGVHYTVSGAEVTGSDGSRYIIVGNSIINRDNDQVCSITSSGQIYCY